MGRKERKGGHRELCTLQPVIPCLGVHLCQLFLQMSVSPHCLQILISSLIKGVGISLPGRLHAYSSPSCPDSQHQLNGTWQELSTQAWEQSNETCEAGCQPGLRARCFHKSDCSVLILGFSGLRNGEEHPSTDGWIHKRAPSVQQYSVQPYRMTPGVPFQSFLP